MKLSEAKCRAHSEIKNIILDWGGVITDLHFKLGMEAFARLGFSLDWSTMGKEGDDIFLPYEIGEISTDEFRTRIRKNIGRPVSDEEINDAWKTIMGDLPEERWRLLEKLKGRYRMFLLSNTNAMHVEYYTGYIMEKYGTEGIFHLFERTYFSHELGMRKPGREIFEYVINNEKLVPSETLFVDDFEENITAAASAGLYVYHLKAPETMTDLFIY